MRGVGQTVSWIDRKAMGVTRQMKAATPIRAILTAIAAVTALAVVGPAVAQAAPAFEVELVQAQSNGRDDLTVYENDGRVDYRVQLTNAGDAALSGSTTVAFDFPDGVRLGQGGQVLGGSWFCYQEVAVCTVDSTAGAGQPLPPLDVNAWLIGRGTGPLTSSVTAFGGGTVGTAFDSHTLTVQPALPFDLVSLTAGAHDLLGNDYTQAGGHPHSATASFMFTTILNGAGNAGTANQEPSAPVDAVRNIITDLPPGFVGNLNAVGTTCTATQVREGTCPASAAVGGLDLATGLSSPAAMYRLEQEKGYVASFVVRPVPLSPAEVVIRVKLRSNGDYGVTAVSPLPPQTFTIYGVRSATLCNHGARAGGFNNIVFLGCKEPGESGSSPVPFLTNPTDCGESGPVTAVAVDSFENRGNVTADAFPDLADARWKTRAVESPVTEGCDAVPFDPSMAVAPTSATPDSATGLDVDLDVPQDGLVEHDGIATAHLRKTVVELPEGFSVNPSAATGLVACTDGQVAKDRLTPVTCPEGSKLGTARVTSPLIEFALRGHMYLGEPKSTDPSSGEMFRLWLVVENKTLGVVAKIDGSATVDPVTGKITATFDQNPRVPFDKLEVDLKGGQRGVLATPRDCGGMSVKSTLTPWSGTGPQERLTDVAIGGDCGNPFAPKLAAGSSDNRARGLGGTYSFKFSREDGEQWLRGLTAKLPNGLLASVKDVPLCSNGAADAGNCPAASKIGVVDAKAGAGDPFVLEQKGEVFLTEGYKGGEYGLAVKIRPVAGPFRGQWELSPIIVRQAIHVDRTTAQVTAISDPFPLIHHGIPLRAREVHVLVDRGGFMFNPSDCDQKQTGASLLSDRGATVDRSDPFQVSGCASLAFKPKLTLALTGRKQTRTGKHPGINATVIQQGVSEAGIEKAVVRLPKSLALDVNNAQALCEYTDGTKPDLENHCPKGSIVGRARAKTPLLKDDLVGNVYFVKNVRIDPRTGNQIRTLPMIIVALRGEIAINLVGESSTTKDGKLVNTFANVPDAPISQFNLNITGGKNGIIAVTRTRKAKINLCAGRHVAETDMDGQNGRRHDFDVRMKTPCTKRQVKNAKRAARRR